MRFKAKSGIERELSITDRDALAASSSSCQDLPGQNLFQYLDDDGEPHPVTSTDVNDYIREATGEDFTAKHFRTWSASVIAFEQICAAGEEGIGLKAMLEPVAEALGNTPAISRKSYVHPALIDAVKEATGRLRLAMPAPDEISVERRAGPDRLPRQENGAGKPASGDERTGVARHPGRPALGRNARLAVQPQPADPARLRRGRRHRRRCCSA